MDFFSNLRLSRTRVNKIVTAALGLVIFAAMALVAVSGFLVYRVVAPAGSATTLRVGDLLGHPSAITFTVAGGDTREGWFFPGLRGAPTIILCHGYRSHRAEILTLATRLQENRFNVFLFDFAGHGGNGGIVTFGYRETEEVLAAIEAVVQRDDVDRERLGLWGVNIGGYAAVAAAAADQRVRAFVVDSVYEEPVQMFRLELERYGMGKLPLVGGLARFGFRLLTFSHRNAPPLSQRLSGLAGVAKLFIQARNTPVLAESTLQLFLQSPEPREQAVIQRSHYALMLDEEKREYERYIVTLLIQNLHPVLPPRR
jgi:pimeloyl-ACP methyl ester carboxylesterase